MRPNDLEMRRKYTEYVRSQVQIVSLPGFIVVGIITIICAIPSIKGGGFALLGKTMTPDIIVFLLSLSLTFCIAVCYIIARKYPIASEFVFPSVTLCFILICIPTYYENPKTSTIVHGSSLIQLYFAGHLYYLALTMFFTASYLPALVSRIIFLGFFLNLGIRRRLEGSATTTSILFNYLMTVTIIELNLYNIHRKTLQLFIEKESNVV
jgi:hypothetical protein